MMINDIGELIKDKSLVNIRCGSCLRIVVSKDGEDIWTAPFEHSCWNDWGEIEVRSVWLGGRVGELLTVYPIGFDKDNNLVHNVSQ